MFCAKDEAVDDHLSLNSKSTKIQRLRSFEIHPILPYSLQTESIELTDGIVLRVTDKSLFSSLLRILPQLSAEFEHLKRVNGNDLLVKVGQQQQQSIIANEERTAIANVLGEEPAFISRQIPCRKPRSKAQLDIYRKWWPMSFHKNAKLESMIDGTLLSEATSSRVKQLFVHAEKRKGALFYDPDTDQIVAEGTQSDERRPLAHSVMNAIEHLAAKQENESDSEKSAQYLATGFYAILAVEPCTMCAMALVHVRVSRVFFGAFNTNFGAVCSKWRLQESANINHHFDVFQIVEML